MAEFLSFEPLRSRSCWRELGSPGGCATWYPERRGVPGLLCRLPGLKTGRQVGSARGAVCGADLGSNPSAAPPWLSGTSLSLSFRPLQYGAKNKHWARQPADARSVPPTVELGNLRFC